MAVTFVGAGTAVGGSGANDASPHASWAIGDVLLFLLETANQAVPATPTGWNPMPDTPAGVGTAGALTGATRLTWFWRIADKTALDSPNSGDSGDHQYFQVFAFRGAKVVGNPYNATAVGSSASSDTSVSVPGLTTTVDGCYVVAASAHDVDGTNTASAMANASLASVTALTALTTGTAQGGGGGFHVAGGIKTTAGAVDPTTWTLGTATVDSYATIALAPTPVGSKYVMSSVT